MASETCRFKFEGHPHGQSVEALRQVIDGWTGVRLYFVGACVVRLVLKPLHLVNTSIAAAPSVTVSRKPLFMLPLPVNL